MRNYLGIILLFITHSCGNKNSSSEYTTKVNNDDSIKNDNAMLSANDTLCSKQTASYVKGIELLQFCQIAFGKEASTELNRMMSGSKSKGKYNLDNGSKPLGFEKRKDTIYLSLLRLTNNVTNVQQVDSISRIKDTIFLKVTATRINSEKNFNTSK
jgi:hypothetical protein